MNLVTISFECQITGTWEGVSFFCCSSYVVTAECTRVRKYGEGLKLFVRFFMSFSVRMQQSFCFWLVIF